MLLIGEVTAGPVLLLAMFAGSLLIGLRAQAPVEQARRRQLEFTADASHELRTPLSVIRAETDLALATPAQGGRLPRHPAADPGRERAAAPCWSRTCSGWRGSTPSRRTRTRARRRGHGRPGLRRPVPVGRPGRHRRRHRRACADQRARPSGSTGWSACCSTTPAATPGRTARSGSRSPLAGSRVTLTVEDSGPGIPADQRPRLFDRFSRATEQQSGTGLGLAIGDSVVKSTGGRWDIGDSPLGGALLRGFLAADSAALVRASLRLRGCRRQRRSASVRPG